MLFYLIYILTVLCCNGSVIGLSQQNARILVFFPEMFESFDDLKSVTDIILKVKTEYNIDIFLVPDAVYDFLKSMLDSVDYDYDEYSTRKWLTGFVPDVDKALLAKIHIIVTRKDVIPISKYLPESKAKEPFDQVVEIMRRGDQERFLYICKGSKIEELKDLGFIFGIKPLKKHKNVFLLQINA